MQDAKQYLNGRGRVYDARGMCVRAAADICAWATKQYPQVKITKRTMFLVVWDKRLGRVCGDGVAMFKFPGERMTPDKAVVHIAKMYEMGPELCLWSLSHDLHGPEPVNAYLHEVACIGNEQFLDWAYDQFLVPDGFEMRLVERDVAEWGIVANPKSVGQ
jgi:hypothetical protein